MRLRELFLDHYRSYDSVTLSWHGSGTEVLIGENGSGKTNILEAIGLLSTGTSFLGIDADYLPTWGSDHFRVRGVFTGDDDSEQTVEVAWQRQPPRTKAFFLNDVRVPSAKFIGHVSVLTFLPSDLSLFVGSPSARRTYIDTFLRQIDPSFRMQLSSYESCVKQRNALLRSIAEGTARETDLALWDERLAQAGALVRRVRLRLLERLQSTLPVTVTSLSETPTTVELRYEKKGEARDTAEMEEELKSHLTHYRPRDLIIGSTTVGPHRDDVSLVIDGHIVGESGSRGQQRTYLLALLLCRAELLREVRGEEPIVLLDDVFSELDDAHGAALMSSLSGAQIFITTTHTPPLDTRGTLYDVSDNAVQRRGMAAAIDG